MLTVFCLFLDSNQLAALGRAKASKVAAGQSSRDQKGVCRPNTILSHRRAPRRQRGRTLAVGGCPSCPTAPTLIAMSDRWEANPARGGKTASADEPPTPAPQAEILLRSLLEHHEAAMPELPDLNSPEFRRSRLAWRGLFDHKADIGAPHATDQDILDHVDDITALMLGALGGHGRAPPHLVAALRLVHRSGDRAARRPAGQAARRLTACATRRAARLFNGEPAVPLDG